MNPTVGWLQLQSRSALYILPLAIFLLCSGRYLEIDLRACADRRACISSHPVESLWRGEISFWLAQARELQG